METSSRARSSRTCPRWLRRGPQGRTCPRWLRRGPQGRTCPRWLRRGPQGRWLLAASLLAALHAAPAAAQDLADAIPGQLDVAGLVDLRGIFDDFPRLGSSGFLADKLAEVQARGFPDPRKELSRVGLGARLSGAGLEEAMALAEADVPLTPLVEKLAAEKEVCLSREAYRGVTFLKGSLARGSSIFADLGGSLVFSAHSPRDRYDTGNLTVDTLNGANQSFRARHERSLDGATYLTARMVLSDEVRDGLDGKLAHLAHLTAGSAELTKAGDLVRLELRATATGGIKARIAAFALSSKLSGLAEEIPDPAVRKLLESTRVDRDGKTIVVTAEATKEVLDAGLAAIEDLALAKVKEKKPEWVD